MSDLRIAVVAEGPTDLIVIEAALKALLPRSFVPTLLQPEATRPKLGTGWGGVLRWCLEFASRHHGQLEDDPLLQEFDLLVIHVDADVAGSAYEDVGPETAVRAHERGWPPLPCATPCPPPDGSVAEMRRRVLAWANLGALGPKTVLCVPSKSVDAWLAAAVLDGNHALLNDLECNLNLEDQLGVLPMANRVRKSAREYRTREKQVTDAWRVVRERCTQADRFSNDIGAVPL